MLTLVIIIITVLVSIACFKDDRLFDRLSFSAYRVVKHNEWYRLITHGFVHADWTHLFVNMFTFYSFGSYMEDLFAHFGGGVWEFSLLYFGGMIVASLHDLYQYRNDRYYTSIGASGAVSAVLFSFILFNPWEKVYLFAILPIPGILFGLAYLLYCQYMAKRSADNVNHNAHFYGAVYGFVLPILLNPQSFHIFWEQLTHG